MLVFAGIMVLLGVIVVAAVITGLAVGAIRRDPRRGSGTLGRSVLEVQSLFEPEKRHAAESMRAEREDESEAGDDPLKSAPE
jgi:hypothetical protein